MLHSLDRQHAMYLDRAWASAAMSPYLCSDPVLNFKLLIVALVTKNSRDLFQTLSRCFRDKEERENRRGKAEAAEEEIGAPAKLDLHLRNDNTDDEIGKPHHGGGGTNTFGTLGVGKHLGRESPCQWAIRASVCENIDV